MVDFVAKRSVKDAGRITFRDIFSAVHTDDNDIVRVLDLDLPQLRKNVDAIDSTISPKVEKNDAATKALERKRLSAGVDPVKTWRKLRSANSRQVREWL